MKEARLSNGFSKTILIGKIMGPKIVHPHNSGERD